MVLSFVFEELMALNEILTKGPQSGVEIVEHMYSSSEMKSHRIWFRASRWQTEESIFESTSELSQELYVPGCICSVYTRTR